MIQENTSSTISQSAPPVATLSSNESERMLLAIALNEQRRPLLGQLLGLVSKEDFFIEHHGLIWSCVRTLSDTGKAHDAAALLDYTRQKNIFVGGLEYVVGLVDDVLAANASDEAIHACAKRIKELSTMRLLSALMRQGASLIERGGNTAETVIAQMEDGLSNLRKLGESSRTGPVHIRTILGAVLADIQSQMDGETLPACTTGYQELDNVIGGFADEDFIVCAARPSMGKTAFINNLARNGAKANKPGLIFSLEMKDKALGLRMLSRESHVNLNSLKRAEFNNSDDWSRITEGLDALEDAPIWIDDTPGLTTQDIRARARAFVAEHGKATIYIDYIQFVSQSDKDKGDSKQHVSDVSRAFKNLARELKCPVVALSQLNRALEQRANKRPIMSDLRESGAIEQDADLIMFIYRDEVYNPDTKEPGIAEIIIAKQRDGAIGTVKLGFSGTVNHFFSMSGDGAY